MNIPIKITKEKIVKRMNKIRSFCMIFFVRPKNWLVIGALALLVGTLISHTRVSAFGINDSSTESFMMYDFHKRRATEEVAKFLQRYPAANFAANKETIRTQLKDMSGMPTLDSTATVFDVSRQAPYDVIDGVRIQKILLKTLPGIYSQLLIMKPADASGRLPVIFMLPGTGEPFYGGFYYRGMAMAKAGYLVVENQPFGQGERGDNAMANESLTSKSTAFLLATGQSLAGIITAEQERALQYVRQRPDADSNKIGITGVSMGGSLTQWLAGVLPGFHAAMSVSGNRYVVPVTSGRLHVGLPDVIPSVYRYMGNSEILQTMGASALPLWVGIPADENPITPEGEEKLVKGEITLEQARNQYGYSQSQLMSQTYFPYLLNALGSFGGSRALLIGTLGTESGGHNYGDLKINTALGFFGHYLKGLPTTDPIIHPTVTIPSPPTGVAMNDWLWYLFNFFDQDGTNGPRNNKISELTHGAESFVTPSQYTVGQIRKLVDQLPTPVETLSDWNGFKATLSNRVRTLLGVDPFSGSSTIISFDEIPSDEGSTRAFKFTVQTEQDIRVTALLYGPSPAQTASGKLAVLLHPSGMDTACGTPERHTLQKIGSWVACFSLRGMAPNRSPFEQSAYLGWRDYDVSVQAIELGETLAGYWTKDLLASLTAAKSKIQSVQSVPVVDVKIIGEQETGFAAVLAGIFNPEITEIEIRGLLASYYSPNGYGKPYYFGSSGAVGGYPSMVPIVPGILKHADVQQVVALFAPRKLTMVDPMLGDGIRVQNNQAQFSWLAQIYQGLHAASNLSFVTPAQASTIATTFTLDVSSRMDVGLSAPSAAIAGSPVSLTATVSNYTGDPQDTINYKFWKHCTSAESQNLSAIISACGNPDASFDGVSANPQTVSLAYVTQGSFIPKVFVQRGAAAGEDRASSVTIGAPLTFSLSNSGNITVTQGDAVQNSSTITVTKTGGTAAPVGFFAAGLPAGANAAFTPATCTPASGSPATCTSVMSVATIKGSGATPAGSYPLSVTGTSASFTSTPTTLTLTVNSSIAAGLGATPTTGYAPLDVKLTADASGYTGDPSDSLTYTFWWDCNKIGTDLTALKKSVDQGGCGDPSSDAVGFVFPGEKNETKDTPIHTYATPGSYTGKVVIEQGAARDEARIAVSVANAGGAPVARVKISTNANAGRLYQDTVTVKKGEPTRIFLAADDGTGDGSFDPDGWTSPNGVSASGKCEWNTTLAQTLPVPFDKTISTPRTASACNIDLGTLTFNDAPGTYSYDVLRITDNNGLPSNIARIRITVSPEPVNVAPVAAVKISSDTSASRQYFDSVTVQRNVSTPLYLAADDGAGSGSYDPDGWTSPNGVSGSGKCEWNTALSTDLPVPFDRDIGAPASAADCNLFIGNKTFSNPVGQYVYDVLRITDNKGLPSNIARIRIDVTEVIIVNTAPVAAVKISTDRNADRVYADSITVQRGAATPIFLAADDGSGTMTFDPDGWTAENGVAGSGKCEWNSDLSQTLPVPFATVFNRPANPAECNVFIGDKTFNDAPGTYVYDVLRITDNKGLRSNIARIRIAVEEIIVTNHQPVAAAKVSTDRNFDRQYFDSVWVTRGVATPIYVAADDGTAEKSYDPDGWTSANGVSATGKCEWNSMLSQQDPVPFSIVSTAPRSAASCNVGFGDKTFNDAPGTYTYGVLRITDNQGLASNIATIRIMVSDAPPPPSNLRPVARAQVSTNPNFNRTYFDSVSVQRGVATPIYGSAALSSDPDGWDTANLGVSSGGRCEWNRDLSQDDPVSFESPAIQNPATPADCNALLGTLTFNDAPGTYVYGALRLTDAGGLRSAVAPITITISTTPPGPGNNSPVAHARISKNRNFNRTYDDSLAVVRGELTPLYVAADDGTGAPNVSYDPDGWSSDNGVSSGGRCEWNRDLSQDDPVSFESPAVVSPASASDCNTYLGDFTFNDVPGEYVYGMLRITDNKGLRSSIAPITITVAASHAPVAVAGISKDSSFDRIYQPLIEVPQGVATPIFVAAIQGTIQDPTKESLDPDGWTDPSNGLSNGGKCEWNRDLVLSEPVFKDPATVNPPTPADCRISLGNRIFNDSSGTYAYGIVKITDAGGLASNIAIVRIRVGLPDLVPAAPQIASGALVEGGSVTFSDIVRNRGEITAEGTIPNRFQVDLGNDGTIDLTIGNPTLQNLISGDQASVTSGSWNNIPLGTHRIIFMTNTDGLVVESNRTNNTGQLIVTVSSQQLSVSLSANPSSVTTAQSVALSATVPGIQGLPVNYSFWWNCNDATNNVSAAASSCGALPLPASGSCVSNAAGAKCDGVDALSQSVSHTYSDPGSYTPKVIVERGSDTPAESRVPIVVTSDIVAGPLAVSCSFSPSSVHAGESVTWSAFPTGGTGSYTFLWHGDQPLEGKTGNPVVVSYDTVGTKTGSVTVTSGPDTKTAECGPNDGGPPPPGGPGGVSVGPGILGFTSGSSTIVTGQSTTLSWSSVGFSSCTINSQSVPLACNPPDCPNSQDTVAPTSNTTYTLTCTSNDGSQQTKTLIIRVGPPPQFREIVP